MSIVGGVSKITKTTNHSGVTTSDGLKKRIKHIFFESVCYLVEHEFTFLKYITVILEIVGMVLVLMYIIHSHFDWIEGSEKVVRYFLFFVRPTTVLTSVAGFTTAFIVFGIWVSITFFLVTYVIFVKNENSALNFVAFLLTRSTRTIFLFSFVNLFGSPVGCHYFDGSFVWEHFDQHHYVVFEFPFIFFYIFGILFWIATFLICVFDVLFLCDRFRSVRYFTATTDGRFLLVVYVILLTLDFLEQILHSLEHQIGEYLSVDTILGLVFGCIFWVVVVSYWRIVPFYNKVFSLIYSSFLTLVATLLFCGSFLNLTNSYFGILYYLLCPLTVAINLLMVTARYYVIIKYFKKDIKFNWLCSTSHDIALIVILTKKKMNQIQNIIKDVKFAKSKRVCCALSGILIEDNIGVANQIIKHCDSIFGEKTLVDTDLFVHYYRKKISDIQFMGNQRDGKRKVRKMLKRVKRHEKSLRKLLRDVFASLLEEEVNFSNYSKMFTSIQENMEVCEKIFLNLIQVFPSEAVYRRYGIFLETFKNDKKTSESFFKEASDFDSDVQTFTGSSTSIVEIPSSTELKELPKMERESEVVEVRAIQKAKSYDDFKLLSEVTGKERESNSETFMKKSSSGSLAAMESPSLSETCLSVETKSVKSEFSEKSLISNERKGKIRKSISNLFSDRSTYEELRKKFEGQKHWSYVVIMVVVVLLLLFVMTLVTVTFAVGLQMIGDFSTSAEYLRNGVHARERTSSVRLYARKMQTSILGNVSTPIDYQRDYDIYRSFLHNSCGEIESYSKTIFKSSDKRYLSPFTKHYTLFENVGGSGVTTNRSVSLYDAIVSLSKKCYLIADTTHEEALEAMSHFHDEQDDHHDHRRELKNDYHTMRRLLDCVFDEEAFFFVLMNEEIISIGLNEVIGRMSEVEKIDAMIFAGIFVLLPLSGFVFLVFLFVIYCILLVEQKKLWKGLLLIPREEVIKKYEFFGGNLRKETSKGRIARNQVPLLSRFFLQGSVLLFVVMGLGLFFTIFSVITCFEFIKRNDNFHRINMIEVKTRDMHSLLMEALYIDSSIFQEDEIIRGSEQLADDISIEYDRLRFERDGLNSYGYSKDILYDHKCIEYEYHDEENDEDGEHDEHHDDELEHNHRRSDDLEESHNETHEHDGHMEETIAMEYACQSLNTLVITYLENAKRIITHLKMENNITVDLLIHERESDHWNSLIVLEDYHGGSSDVGILKLKIHVLSDAVDSSLDVFLQIIRNGSIVTFVLILPVILIVSFLMFRLYADRISYYLALPKHLVMLFPKNVILKNHIFDFVIGKSSLSKCFEQSTVANTEKVLNIVKDSQFAILVFDRKFKISYGSKSAHELFNVKKIQHLDLPSFFSEDSFTKIRDFTRKPIGNPFVDTLTMTVNDYEIQVNVEINRDKQTFITFIENVESSKRKQILEAAEKRSEKANILLRSIFPSSIADELKLEDRYNLFSQHKECTAIFADIVNFTKWSTQQEPEQMLKILNELISRFDDLAEEFKVEKIKTIGEELFPEIF